MRTSASGSRGSREQLWKTHAALGQFHAARQRADEAGQAYRAARVVLDRMRAGLPDPALRTSLADTPAVRQVYERAGAT